MQDSPCGHLPRWRRFGKTRPVPSRCQGQAPRIPKIRCSRPGYASSFLCRWYYFPAEKSGIIFPAFSSVIKKTSVSPSSRRRAGSGWVNRIDPRRNPNSRMPKRSFRSSSAMVFPSAGDPASTRTVWICVALKSVSKFCIFWCWFGSVHRVKRAVPRRFVRSMILATSSSGIS